MEGLTIPASRPWAPQARGTCWRWPVPSTPAVVDPDHRSRPTTPTAEITALPWADRTALLIRARVVAAGRPGPHCPIQVLAEIRCDFGDPADRVPNARAGRLPRPLCRDVAECAGATVWSSHPVEFGEQPLTLGSGQLQGAEVRSSGRFVDLLREGGKPPPIGGQRRPIEYRIAGRSPGGLRQPAADQLQRSNVDAGAGKQDRQVAHPLGVAYQHSSATVAGLPEIALSRQPGRV